MDPRWIQQKRQTSQCQLMWPLPPINPPNPAYSKVMKPQPQSSASQLPASEWLVANRQASSSEWANGRTGRRLRINDVGTLANGYVKSIPLPRVTARAAHVTTVTDIHQALTPVPYGLAPVPLSSPMTKHQFSHESESFVQPLIMRRDTSLTTSYYLPRLKHTVLIN